MNQGGSGTQYEGGVKNTSLVMGGGKSSQKGLEVRKLCVKELVTHANLTR